MRTEQLVESQPAILELTREEAAALARAGRGLASTKSWWGANAATPAERSVIQCQPSSGGKWKVQVQDAIGLISVGSLQLVVQPKIPQDHLLYLLAEGGHVPRLSDERGEAAAGSSLWELIAHWYVGAAERVLRRDLLRDYSEEQAFLPAKRGRLVALATSRSFYAGRLGFECHYEEFTVDTPLNRLLKAAAVAIVGSDLLRKTLRRRAQAIRSRMDRVGDLQPGDDTIAVDRRSSYYTDAIQLARHILRSQGRVLSGGELSAWTFLIRTPEMVEDGMRLLLSRRLGLTWLIAKRGVQVGGGITFTPDVVFQDGRIVADVKYKLLNSDWSRSDLYQIVAFGTAFQAAHAAIFGFSAPEQRALPRAVTVGPVKVTSLCWPADPSVAPETAAAVFGNRVEAWLMSSGEDPGQRLAI